MSREQVFWGWGEPGAGPSLPEHAGRVPARCARRARAAWWSGRWRSRTCGCARRRFPTGCATRLAAIAELRDDREIRVLRCRGKSYLDLLAQRAGDCEAAPDAVVRPASHEQVQAVLRLCVEAGVGVVPFGGGTSVVGGLEASRERFEAVISLDLGGLDRLVSVDERSLTAVLEPGLRLPEADRALGEHGLRLAHVPQSYEWATVGGCVATRSAGQSSTGHGRIDENVVAVRCATPGGRSGDARARRAAPARRCAS